MLYVCRKVLFLITLFFLFSGCSLSQSFEVSEDLSSVDSNAVLLSVHQKNISLNENNILTLVLVFDKNLPSDSSISWSIENGTSDFSTTSGGDTISKGSSSFSISIAPINDSVHEPSKYYTLSISGDQSFKNSLNVEITLNDDDSPLDDPTLTLLDTITSSTTLTNQSTVNVNLGSDSTSVFWCLSEVQTTKPTSNSSDCNGGQGSSNGWHTSRPSSFILSSGDGSKSVYLWIADIHGNINSGPINATIELDTSGLPIPTVSLNDALNNSTSQTYNSTVNLAITSDSGATKWCVIEQASASSIPSTPAYDDPCFTAIKPTQVSLSSTGNRSAYVYLLDSTLNISSPGVASITYSLNQNPILALDSTVVAKDSSPVLIDVLANDSDPESESLTITAKTDGSNGATISISGNKISYQPNAGYYGIDSFTYTVEDPRGGSSVGTVNVRVMTPFTWTGLAGDNNWSSNNNWCGTITSGACAGGAPPGTGDVAVFNSACTNCNATINSSIDVAGIEMQAGYTGSIVQGSGVTISVGTQDLNIGSGTLVGSNADFTLTGSFNISGGSFSAPSATINIYKNFIYSSGSVDMGMSTLRFYGKPQGSILTTANAFPLYNLDVDKGFDGGPGLDVTGTVYVSNTLSVNFGYSASPFNGGVIEAAGDVYINNATVNTSIKIKLVGNSNQIYSQVGGGLIADLEFASTGGTITLEGYIRVKREVLYTSGNIDAGTSTFSIAGRHWHSQVNLGPVVLNNLQIEKGYDAYPDVYIVGTINVSGDLGINMNGAGDYMYNGAIDVKGNVSVSGIGGVGGSTQLILSGTGDQTITHTSGGFPGGNLTVNKSSGNIILNSALNLSVTNQSFYIQSGTVNMSGYDLTVNNILTLDSGAVLNQGGGALSYGSVVNNGTINP